MTTPRLELLVDETKYTCVRCETEKKEQDFSTNQLKKFKLRKKKPKCKQCIIDIEEDNLRILKYTYEGNIRGQTLDRNDYNSQKTLHQQAFRAFEKGYIEKPQDMSLYAESLDSGEGSLINSATSGMSGAFSPVPNTFEPSAAEVADVNSLMEKIRLFGGLDQLNHYPLIRKATTRENERHRRTDITSTSGYLFIQKKNVIWASTDYNRNYMITIRRNTGSNRLATLKRKHYNQNGKLQAKVVDFEYGQ